MPSENGIHDSIAGFVNSYYSNDSASASATTVPLVYRSSGGNTYTSDRDEPSSLQASTRNSELYDGLLEEVKQPNMPSRMITADNEESIPQSLRVASYIARKPAKVGEVGAGVSNSTGRTDRANQSSKTGSKRMPRAGPRDSLQHRGSGRKRGDVPGASSGSKGPGPNKSRAPGPPDTAGAQTLPSSTFNPKQPQNRLTVDTQQYRAYRPQTTEHETSDSRGNGTKGSSKKPLAVAGVAAGAAAAYTAHDALERRQNSFSPELPATPPFAGSSQGYMPRDEDSPAMGFNDPAFDKALPGNPGPFSPEPNGSGPRDFMSPFDDRAISQAFDNSTPGSPHDSPLELEHPPMSAFMPDENFAHANNFNDGYEGSRELQGSPAPPNFDPVSPSSSFGGSEAFPNDEDYPKTDAEDMFSPSNGPRGFDPDNGDGSLPVTPKEDFMSTKDSFDNVPRGISMDDADPNFSNEKGFDDDFEQKRPLWKRPKILIIAGVVLLLLIIGIGVGVFFAVRSKNKSGSSTDGNSSNDPSNPDPNTPVLGGFRTQDPAFINDAFVQTGTSMSTVTLGGPNRKRQSSNRVSFSSTNFFSFYQHSTGEIRMARYQNSNFQRSLPVVQDSHPGTPVAAYSRSDRVQISVFYFNKQKILQEVRLKDGQNWVPGSIGQLNLTSEAPSDLTVEYVGLCKGSGLAWLVFHTGKNDETKLVYWNEATDVWTEVPGFSGVKQGAGFTGQSDGDAWRFYYVSSQNSQLSQMVCLNCCNSPGAPTWTPGINGPPVTSATGGITVVAAGSPRLIYYQDADGTVRELNNTGKYPREAYQVNVSFGKGGNTGVPAPSDAPTGPIGVEVAKVVPETKMSISAGFIGSSPQLWLFAQWNATDISLAARNVDAVGKWTEPFAIPVQRS